VQNRRPGKPSNTLYVKWLSSVEEKCVCGTRIQIEGVHSQFSNSG
jgi:hypothetical protein